jgi:hypothetical protein
MRAQHQNAAAQLVILPTMQELVLATEMQYGAKLQHLRVFAALAFYSHTGDGEKARGRKDTYKSKGLEKAPPVL